MAPRTLNFGTRRRRVVSFTLRTLYLQRKNPWYPVNMRSAEPMDDVEKRNISLPLQILGCPARKTVTVLTELFQN
jgi:hypothetical protein